MNAWYKVQSEVADIMDQLAADGCLDPWFRGHGNSEWHLIPGLGRGSYNEVVEGRLYYNFLSLAGHLIPHDCSTWDRLVVMQHHGLPTRLLDWTQSFATSLYFAVEQIADEACVWILDPYELNKRFLDDDAIQHLGSSLTFPQGYEAFFTDDTSDDFGRFPAAVVAVQSVARTPRVLSQRGAFTFHRDYETPLEELCPDLIHRVVIPRTVIQEAKSFLRLAGITEATLFPDLDGIARHLLKTEGGDAV